MICSPFSVMMPMAKIALGARRTTLRELLKALGLKSRREIKKQFTSLIRKIEYLPGVFLDVASRIYINSDKHLEKKFQRRTRNIFKSTCERITTNDPKHSAKKINDWVRQKTRGKISNMVKPSDITSGTSIILVNAIYFAGTWKLRFGEPFVAKFESPSGARQLPMIKRSATYKYVSSNQLNAQLVRIPYQGDAAAMIIVLPNDKSGLPVLLRALKLAPRLLNDALQSMVDTTLVLTMPKFKIETELDLVPLYKKLGINAVFTRKQSELTRIITDDTIYVSKAIHKAVIEVNERGTEASAATVIGMVSVSNTDYGLLQLKVDRPFLFFIQAFKEQLFTGTFVGNS